MRWVLHKLGIIRYYIDLTKIHELLYRKKLASRPGMPWVTEGVKSTEELEQAIRQIIAVIKHSQTISTV